MKKRTKVIIATIAILIIGLVAWKAWPRSDPMEKLRKELANASPEDAWKRMRELPPDQRRELGGELMERRMNKAAEELLRSAARQKTRVSGQADPRNGKTAKGDGKHAATKISQRGDGQGQGQGQGRPAATRVVARRSRRSRRVGALAAVAVDAAVPAPSNGRNGPTAGWTTPARSSAPSRRPTGKTSWPDRAGSDCRRFGGGRGGKDEANSAVRALGSNFQSTPRTRTHTSSPSTFTSCDGVARTAGIVIAWPVRMSNRAPCRGQMI